jgi:pancreatic lipase-related protein 1
MNSRGSVEGTSTDARLDCAKICFQQMEWAPRFCARCIAQLINYLVHHPRGVRADDLHLVGYSVGAHISGLVANYLDPIEHGKLGRITGNGKIHTFTQWNGNTCTVTVTLPKPDRNPWCLTSLIELPWCFHSCCIQVIVAGLDPTIVFYMGKNRSRDLDPTDAHFVDVLHTGAGILGQWGPNGHADFYINGGSSQPGCSSDTIFSKDELTLRTRFYKERF